MKPILPVLTLALLSVFACSPSPQATTAIQPTGTLITDDYFPLTVGTYWIYEGTVTWTVEAQVEEKAIQWKMEVVEVIPAAHNNGVTAYVLKGHPRDLAWYEEGKERSDYLIIRSGQSRFYYANIDVLPRLSDKDDNLYNLVEDNKLFLDIPLVPQKKFCEADHITMYDGGYCWIVGEENQVEPGNIRGLETSVKLTEYGIWKGTQPDDEYVGFIPGVGISRYRYNHHGTISQANVELVEFHLGSSEGGS
jgi:hypothetical protein